ncbi:MAG: general secretion pathway protein E [Candidatus Magnetoglobus multicellularis str. Araruama]|uniref:protein-secreting ATPase n=1 Tax=Candidatus Magnetoglobus multicellularis str. Araruama TaxID=890399 RepID=A0A1V1P1T9_9BACT|nr:MAG: general secretion pathway protein E [Candidatus Magnetoglobus multicellularis str. Araruama]
MESLDTILMEQFGISEESINEAHRIQAEKQADYGNTLIQRQIVNEMQLLNAWSLQYKIPVWEKLPVNDINVEFARNVPIQFLKKYGMVPIESRDANYSRQGPVFREKGAQEEYGCRVIAISNPACLQALDDLVRIFGADDLHVIFSTGAAILSATNLSYDMSRDSAEQLVQDMEEETGDSIITEIEETVDLLDDTSDAPIIKLVNHILSQAVKARASDIHMEPFQNAFKVRQRVDGILYDMISPPKRIQSALVSRIKVMADLNIAEKRLPQDGRIEIRIGDKNIDIRVSTLPTTFGERVVLRLLDKTSVLLKLTDLGLSPKQYHTTDELIHSSHGIILVTGPTGSGKTTSLYAILSTINNPDINIITIEDPVEYQIQGIGQIQVNPKIDLTFARGLRSIVRQDPDVILIGEIRDAETAEIAVQSALTGHLVFSTLHTNDSASAITRLIDIGIEPFLLSSSILAVIAQRLVRMLCDECKEPYVPDENSLKSIGITTDALAGKTIYRPKGCNTCLHTGYKGRRAIFEIMMMNDTIKSLCLQTSDSNLIKQEAIKHGMITLRQDGVNKIINGLTSVEEVFRVTQV